MEDDVEVQVIGLLRYLSEINHKLLRLQKTVAYGNATADDINKLQNISRQAEVAKKLFTTQVEFLSTKKQKKYKMLFTEALVQQLVSYSILKQSDATFTNIPEESERLTLYNIDMKDNVLNFAPFIELSELFIDKTIFNLTTNFIGFQYLNKLVFLSLCDNNLTDDLFKPIKIFSHFVSLKRVYLNNNALTKIPDELFNCVNLNVLSMTNNRLTGISSSIGNLIQLRVLALSYNNIRHIPDEVILLSGLRVLDLSDNLLSELNKLLKFSSNHINIINLSGNSISENSTWIGTTHTLNFSNMPTKSKKQIILNAYNVSEDEKLDVANFE